MIALQRVRTAQAVKPEYRGQRKIDRENALLQAYRDSDGNPKFNTAWWKAAKEQLKAEAHYKCAYCEADVAVVAHGDVEHFRPKSEYWWLAYCYDNYLYSCQLCNQTYKGKAFPIHGDRMTAVQVHTHDSDESLTALAGSLAPDPLDGEPRYPIAEYARLAKREKAGLPNPYLEDPESMFAWEADQDNKEVSVKKLNHRVRPTRAFQAAEEYLGLNREQLRRVRWREFEMLDLFRRSFERFNQLGDPLAEEIRNELQLRMADEAPFAGMARYFIRTEWQLIV